MEAPILITAGSTYIFKGKKASNNKTYNKLKILEVTDTTYWIKNVDSDTEYRRGIVDFNYDYKPVEVIETNEQRMDKLIKQLT
tara:strand:- start:272 stop:520 length:249 start_codon:yes stop_codon:yes gene_type:complete